MKAKTNIEEGVKTKATEIFTGSPINVRVDFYCGSYQYADPKFYTIDSVEQFEEIRELTKRYLKFSYNSKAISHVNKTFWATFTPELENEYGVWEYTKYDLFIYRVVI